MTRRHLPALLSFCLASTALAQQLMHWPVRGSREMVGAANNFEVEAGFRMLALGGNAIDAGVAATLAAAITEQSRFGLGGEMPLIIKMKGQPARIVSGVGIAPKLATPEFYNTRPPQPWENAERMSPIPAVGILAAITPGVFDGLMLALETNGTMSFAQVVAPALEYADSFPIGDEYTSFIHNNQRMLMLWPTSREYFLIKDQPPAAGTLFHQPAIARTLRELITVEKKTAVLLWLTNRPKEPAPPAEVVFPEIRPQALACRRARTRIASSAVPSTETELLVIATCKTPPGLMASPFAFAKIPKSRATLLTVFAVTFTRSVLVRSWKA